MEDDHGTTVCQDETMHSGLPSDGKQTAMLHSNSEEPVDNSFIKRNASDNLLIEEDSDHHFTGDTEPNKQTRSQVLLERIYEIIEKRETGQTSKNARLSKVIQSMKEGNEKITEQDIVKIQFKIKKYGAEYDSPHRGVWSKEDTAMALQDARTFSPTGKGKISLGQALQWQVKTDITDSPSNLYNKFAKRDNSQDQQQGSSSVDRKQHERRKSILNPSKSTSISLRDFGI